MASGVMKAAVFMLTNIDLQAGEVNLPSFLVHKAKALEAQGWKVVFGNIDDRTSLLGIFRNYKRLKEEVQHSNAGVVHAQYGSITAAVGHFIRGPRPLVISFVGSDLLGTYDPGIVWRLRVKLSRAIGDWAAQQADAIFVRSQNLLEALPPNLRGKAIILPNGVDADWFKPLDKQACREKLGWNPQEKIVLFSTSHPDVLVKNPGLARQAVEELKAIQPDASLVIMAGVDSEAVRLMMNASDCLLVTSLHEGSPKVVREAMACNLPVVSVDCGDVAERLADVHPSSICGYDARELAKQLKRVIEQGVRSNGRAQLFEQRMTTTDCAIEAIRMYRRIQETEPSSEIIPA